MIAIEIGLEMIYVIRVDVLKTIWVFVGGAVQSLSGKRLSSPRETVAVETVYP